MHLGTPVGNILPLSLNWMAKFLQLIMLAFTISSLVSEDCEYVLLGLPSLIPTSDTSFAIYYFLLKTKVKLVSLLLTLNIFHTLLSCFYCQLWEGKCWPGLSLVAIPNPSYIWSRLFESQFVPHDFTFCFNYIFLGFFLFFVFCCHIFNARIDCAIYFRKKVLNEKHMNRGSP